MPVMKPGRRNKPLPDTFLPTPLLTVVVPAFNRERFLDATLRSIEAQSLRPFDVVLVDNRSTDHSLQIMQEWAERVQSPELRVTILSEPCRGAAAARNCGFKAVRTSWVMFFDSDDIMLPNHLADFAAFIAANPEVDLVGRSVRAFSQSGKRLYTGLFTNREPLYNHLFHGILSTQRWAARRSLVEAAGGWNPATMAWDDLESGLRILLQQPRVAVVPGKPSVKVIVHDDSITGAAFSLSPSKWLNALDICETECKRANRADLACWIDCRRAILAANLYREGSRSDARRILDATLLSKSQPVRRRLKMVYLIQRFFGHGASFMSKYLFPH